MANRKLARKIADIGFYEFRRQLEYKTKLNGAELVTASVRYNLQRETQLIKSSMPITENSLTSRVVVWCNQVLPDVRDKCVQAGAPHRGFVPVVAAFLRHCLPGEVEVVANRPECLDESLKYTVSREARQI